MKPITGLLMGSVLSAVMAFAPLAANADVRATVGESCRTVGCGDDHKAGDDHRRVAAPEFEAAAGIGALVLVGGALLLVAEKKRHRR